MEQRLSLVTLGVSNLKASTDFYRNVFGWKPVNPDDENITFFQLNGFQLALFERTALAHDAMVDPAGEGFRSFTLAYNVRSEKEVDDLITELRNKGVRILKEPQKVFWGGYSSYVCDPDGHLWEIAFNPFVKIDEKGNLV
jgi:uncharacterized protein